MTLTLSAVPACSTKVDVASTETSPTQTDRISPSTPDYPRSMKIIDRIRKAEAEGRNYWSFEYFPPKTTQGVLNLFDRMNRMYQLGPEFIDVTWGAGGTTSEVTLEICATAQAVYGLETCMHLTCTNMPKEKIDIALKEAKASGIQNILALRGDPPRGQSEWKAVETGFSHAADLVRYIREKYGSYFGIAVAGYPEGHIDNPDKALDLQYLKDKIDQGADYIVTQLFYDVDLFLKWVDQCRKIGITCPIIPGIMPIQSYGGFKRMTTLCKTIVPSFIEKDLEPIKDDDQAVRNYGVSLAIKMCKQLGEVGFRGFHFYTLNLEKSVGLILEGLEFVAPQEIAKPLPWNPSLIKKREGENVRPIFWKNRVKSYLSRTESWDEFPNGRWGDSRSPAYGDLDGYGVAIRLSKDEVKQVWGAPESLADICNLFYQYCKNEVTSLPWSDQPLSGESEVIRSKLAELNLKGFLTINSQPAVDGVSSAHEVHGWGPKNGYVYQKAYLEFFIQPELLDKLVNIFMQNPSMTFYAVNKQGDLRTNTQSDGPNAVTWGVFPGKEIVQPTVVETVSFMAWKDEAFQIWNEWADVYSPDSITANLLNNITNSWFLVNVVDNDFKNPNGIFDIFKNI